VGCRIESQLMDAKRIDEERVTADSISDDSVPLWEDRWCECRTIVLIQVISETVKSTG
jgi:hypothetical protein